MSLRPIRRTVDCLNPSEPGATPYLYRSIRIPRVCGAQLVDTHFSIGTRRSLTLWAGILRQHEITLSWRRKGSHDHPRPA